jgi:DNA-binding SARP family transcriptional activator
VTIAASARSASGHVERGIVGRSETQRPYLRLLAEFQLTVEGRAIRLPHSVERIVAFLGMSRRPVNRSRLAASLWPDVADHRANGDLRSALWRLRRLTGIIEEEDNRLTLAPPVDVDVVEMTDLTQTLIARPARPALDRVPDLVIAHEILPDWDEEWLIAERERYRIQRLRALERSAEALLATADHAAALDAAMASVSTEPYRETAHRLVIKIHLAEGNNAEALRAYRTYRALVANELGIAPSPRMNELVASLSPRLGPMTGR